MFKFQIFKCWNFEFSNCKFSNINFSNSWIHEFSNSQSCGHRPSLWSDCYSNKNQIRAERSSVALLSHSLLCFKTFIFDIRDLKTRKCPYLAYFSLKWKNTLFCLIFKLKKNNCLIFYIWAKLLSLKWETWKWGYAQISHILA